MNLIGSTIQNCQWIKAGVKLEKSDWTVKKHSIWGQFYKTIWFKKFIKLTIFYFYFINFNMLISKFSQSPKKIAYSFITIQTSKFCYSIIVFLLTTLHHYNAVSFKHSHGIQLNIDWRSSQYYLLLSIKIYLS